MAIPDLQRLMLPALRFAAEKRSDALVDGPELAGLMIDHGIGVTTVANYAVRRIDADYFDDQDEAPDLP